MKQGSGSHGDEEGSSSDGAGSTLAEGDVRRIAMEVVSLLKKSEVTRSSGSGSTGAFKVASGGRGRV